MAIAERGPIPDQLLSLGAMFDQYDETIVAISSGSLVLCEVLMVAVGRWR